MTIILDSGQFSGYSGLLGLHNLFKSMCGKAGFPAPIQDYTTASPYFLVYQFEENNFLVLSATSGTNINFCVYKTWNTTTRTGTGNSFATISTNPSNASNLSTFNTLKDTQNNIGIINVINSANTSISLNFGFIKIQEKFAEYPNTYPLILFFWGTGSQLFSAFIFRTYGTEDKVGNQQYPDTITKNLFLQQLINNNGKTPLQAPVVFYSGGYPVGISNDVVYCPNLNANLGQRLIVEEGVEEYIYCGGDLAVRDI